jgi:tetratricopeptide (TPR) repeat protein
VLSEILEAAGQSPLVTVAGPVGSGRSTLLGRLGEAWTDREFRTILLRPSPNPMTTPLYTVLRSIGRPRGADAAPAVMWWSPADPLTGTHSPAAPRHTATAIAESLAASGKVAILIDDAQWLDPHSLAVLEQLVRRLAGTNVRCVCAVRVPVSRAVFPAGHAVFEQLRRDGLARQMNLRPLGAPDITAMTAAAFEAKPDPDLVTHLRQITGGLPAALVPLIEQYQRDGSVLVVDGHAYLVPRPRPPVLPDNHQLLMSVRRIGPLAWSVAKAVSVLYPLGEAVPRLVGETLDIAETAARQALDELTEAGVLRYSPVYRRWHFRVPLLGSALSAHLGPYERRHLAQRATLALWQGNARCADPDYPADQLAIAGKLVDPERARTELLARAAAPAAAGCTERWLRSAAALSADRSDQAHALLTHATVSLRHGDYRQTLLSSETIRRELDDRLSADEFQELDRAHVLALHATGDIASLEQMTGLTGKDRIIARATALLLRGRWRECDAVLTEHRNTAGKPPLSAYFHHLLQAQVHLFRGRRGLAEWDLDEADRRLGQHAERHRFDLGGFRVLTALVTGGAGSAERLLAGSPESAETLPVATEVVLAMRQGRFDRAMELARRAIVAGTVRGQDPAHTFLYQSAAMIQLSWGKLARSREFLLAARETDPPLPYLLDGAEALIDRALGQPDQARKRLRYGLEHAADRGLVLETDRLWRQLAELELARGEFAEARRCVTEIDRVDALLGTTGTALNLALARAVLERDRDAADEAVRLARERNEPFEFAEVAAKLVQRDVGEPSLLAESYEILGGSGALLNRARLRNLMQERGVSIPGRRQTVAENDRLLSVLVADGLANKQIATVLQASEKSVESRLGRLFSRTGYRSRVELAMAALTGEALVS